MRNMHSGAKGELLIWVSKDCGKSYLRNKTLLLEENNQHWGAAMRPDTKWSYYCHAEIDPFSIIAHTEVFSSPQ